MEKSVRIWYNSPSIHQTTEMGLQSVPSLHHNYLNMDLVSRRLIWQDRALNTAAIHKTTSLLAGRSTANIEIVGRTAV